MIPRVFLRAALFSLAALAVRPDAGAGSDLERVPLCRPWTAGPCLLEVGATLQTARSRTPLVGRAVRFVAGGDVICAATTGAEGRAACSGIVRSAEALERGGYRVVFEGDEAFRAAGARGALTELGEHGL